MERSEGQVTMPPGPGLGVPASEEKPGEHSALDAVTQNTQQQQMLALTDLVKSLAAQLQSDQRSAVLEDLPGTSLSAWHALIKLRRNTSVVCFITQADKLFLPGHPAKDCFMTNNEKREAFLKKASSSAKAAILKRVADYKKHGKLPVPGEHLSAAAGQSDVHPGLENTGKSLYALRETEQSDLHSGLAETGDWMTAVHGAVCRWNHEHPGYSYLSGSLPYPTPYQLCFGKGFRQSAPVDPPFSGLTVFNYYLFWMGCVKLQSLCLLLLVRALWAVKPVHDCWVYIDTITAFFPNKACLERTPSIWEAGRGQPLGDGYPISPRQLCFKPGLQRWHTIMMSGSMAIFLRAQCILDRGTALSRDGVERVIGVKKMATRALIRAVESYGILIFDITGGWGTDDGPSSDHFGSTHGSYSDYDSDYDKIEFGLRTRSGQWLTKAIRPSVKPTGRELSTELGSLVWSDTCGPFRISAGRYRWFALFVDDSTSWICIFFLKHKSDYLGAFKLYLVEVKCLRSGMGLPEDYHMVLHTDGDSTMIAGQTTAFCKEQGIEQRHGSPYLHENQALREHKLSNGARELRYVGHSEVSSAYLLYDHDSGKVVNSGMVTLSERLDKLGKVVTTWDPSALAPLKTNFMATARDVPYRDPLPTLRETPVLEQGVYLPEDGDEVMAVVKVEASDAVYGLKQAGREWFDTSDAFIMGYDSRMQRSDVEPCLYFIKDTEIMVIILAYVDDYLVATNDKSWYDTFVAAFHSQYACKDLGVLDLAMGTGVRWGDGTAYLSQSGYIS
eukprot:gene7585-biopygen7662